MTAGTSESSSRPASTATQDELEPGTPAAPNERGALVQLLVVLAAVVGLALLLHGEYLLIIIVAFVLIVMLHELGHFVTAKWSGMKVTEYFLGFGPRLWSIRRGETEYGVKAIPAGGYVRIVGMTSAEEVEEPDEPRTYRKATFPRRFAVGVAGSTMHYVMAFALMFGLYAFVGQPTANGTMVSGLYPFSAGKTPAQLAGLKAGDVLVSYDGHTADDPTVFTSYVEAHAGRTITLVVRRDGRPLTLRVTPIDGRSVAAKGSTTPVKPANGPAVGVIGIETEGTGPMVTDGFFSSVGQSVTSLGSLTVATVQGVGQVFSPHGIATLFHDLATSTSSAPQTPAQQAAAADRPVSVVGVVDVATQAAQQNIAELLSFLAYVNIFFGLFNMLPMLPLDGGHVAIAVYERIRSRRGKRYFADVQKMLPFAYAMLAFIAIFGLSALYLDIVSPLHISG